MEIKRKSAKEWFKQADYDFMTASAMLETGRYIYAVFMCHLSVEKQLKGIYTLVLKDHPTKTHDLNYLVEKISLQAPASLNDFIDDLNTLSVPTRYPDELEKSIQSYSKERTEEIYKKTGELRQWLLKKYPS